MNTITTDVAVIGAGTAGLAAYRAARAGGKRAVIVEGGPGGTTCARVGCMPSKLLIAAAEAAHGVARWDEFGLRLDGEVRVDGRAVMARVRRERDRFVGFVHQGVAALPAGDHITGYARFVDRNTLQVGDDTVVKAGAFVIATGSSPQIPPPFRTIGDRLVVNDDVFDWTDLPRAVAVIGPGVIGLELGQALHRLGVAVTLLGREGHVGPFSDPDVRAYATRVFQDEFTLEPDTRRLSMLREGDRVSVRYSGADGVEHVVRVDFVVAATGRAPNVRNLDLGQTGIALDARGVPRFDRETLRCGDSHIFIAGDANDDVPLLHEAADEGAIAGANAAALPTVTPGHRRAGIGVVFSDPQIAVVGPGWRKLAPGSFVAGEVSFEDQGRSRVMLRHKGLARLYADRATGRFLGAEMIGPDAEHLAHLLAWALQMNLTVAEMLRMPFYHPVVEEALRTALRDAAARVQAEQAKAA